MPIIALRAESGGKMSDPEETAIYRMIVPWAADIDRIYSSKMSV